MPSLIDMLGARDEAQAVENLKALAAAPVSITLVGTATGSFFMGTTGLVWAYFRLFGTAAQEGGEAEELAEI